MTEFVGLTVCYVTLQGNWSYLLAGLTSLIGAGVFYTMTISTLDFRKRVGWIWWLMPIEAARNTMSFFDNMYFSFTRFSRLCESSLPEYFYPDLWNKLSEWIWIPKLGLAISIGLSVFVYMMVRRGK